MSIDREAIALLPCPFCGSVDVKKRETFAPSFSMRAFVNVECNGCGCKQHSVESWNRRATPSPPPAVTEPGEVVAFLELDAIDNPIGDWRIGPKPVCSVSGHSYRLAYAAQPPADAQQRVTLPDGLGKIKIDLWCFVAVADYVISKQRLDAYVDLGLMERVQRSPALYQLSAIGQAVIDWSPQPVSAKEGWKWVPVEPTEAMFDAGRSAVMARDCSGKNWSPAQHYEAAGIDATGIPPDLLKGYHSIIPKGQGALLVYAAMLAAAPEAP